VLGPIMPRRLLLFLGLARAASAFSAGGPANDAFSAPPPGSRIKFRRDEQTGRWAMHRLPRAPAGGLDEAARAPMPFHLGLNHPQFLYNPCNAGDKECIAADLLNSKFDGNKTAAQLRELDFYKQWGFTAAGYDAPNEHRAVLPYLKLSGVLTNDNGYSPSAWNPKLLFPDVFNATVQEYVAANVRSACEETRPYHENLIGYIWDDVPLFDIAHSQEQRGADWVTAMRCLPAGAPGRNAYYEFLAARYPGNLTGLCAAYEQPASACTSWDALDLCAVKNTQHPAMMSDDADFLPVIVDEYMGLCNTTIKECDPHANQFMDTVRVTTPDSVLKVIAKYADAASYQPGGDPEYNATGMERFHNVTGLPIIIADIGFSWPHPGYSKTEWHEYASQVDAGAAYAGYVHGAANSGFVLGLNKCMIIDRVVTQPETVLKPGMLDFEMNPHQPFTSKVKQANLAAAKLFEEARWR